MTSPNRSSHDGFSKNVNTKRLSEEIDKVQRNINNVNKMAEDAIATLTQQKEELRRASIPSLVSSKNVDELDTHIRDIMGQHEEIVTKLTEKQVEVKQRKVSIDILDEMVNEMDYEINRIQKEQKKAREELEDKRNFLRQRLNSIEKLDLLINSLTYKIFEAQYDYRKEQENLQEERERLLQRTDLTESQMALTLAELDGKISEAENRNEAYLQGLKAEREGLRRQTMSKTKLMDDKLELIKKQQDSMIAELEAQKLNATPAEIEQMNKKISELKKRFEETNYLNNLQQQGWRDRNEEEKISDILESRGLRITASGRFFTRSGELLTRGEAAARGLLKGIRNSVLRLISGSKTSVRGFDDDESVTGTSTSTESGMPASEDKLSTEDVMYLKTMLGKPLILALAEITAKQPRDPIYYLGHWLFKYRYNQEIDVRKKMEIQELMEERQRLAAEEWQRQLEEEARAAVLDMIIKAEQEGLANELMRIAQQTEMLEYENEELLDEAKDMLGPYDGPTTGQPINL